VHLPSRGCKRCALARYAVPGRSLGSMGEAGRPCVRTGVRVGGLCHPRRRCTDCMLATPCLRGELATPRVCAGRAGATPVVERSIRI
jgi:hypothetical protein